MNLKLRPSEASRWMKCTASPYFLAVNEHLLEEESTFYADEGTKAHELAAECLVLGYEESLFTSKEMAEHVLDYVVYVQSHVGKKDQLLVEKEVAVFYKADQRGFVDAQIYKPNGLTVIDLKYGAGVSVQAVENPQLLIYGASSHKQLKAQGKKLAPDSEVSLIIYQPRVRGEAAVRDWIMPLEEMLERSKEIKSIADSILAKPDKGIFHASEKTCQFCKAKAFCPSFAKMLFDDLPFDMEETLDISKPIEEPELKTLSKEQIARAIMAAGMLDKFIKACKDYALANLKQGKPFPGFKIVAASPNRQWLDEVDAELFLAKYLSEEERTASSLISPAQAEKVLKQKKVPKTFIDKLEKVIVRPPGGPTLAPIDDPRPPFQEVDVNEEFEALS